MSKSNCSKSRDDEQPRRTHSGKPNSRRKNGSHGRSRKPEAKEETLDTSRSNNPAWYFTDEKLADQVSQLAFQNLAGMPIVYDGFQFDVPNIVRVTMNPSPGVQTSQYYSTNLAQNSAINMAGFKLYSRLSAFTGRVSTYAPQDVSTMMLAFGELISLISFIRRAFGVAFTMNMRNRDYPRHMLSYGMCIDADDLFDNYSDYRTRFNALITLVKQLPIPKNVAYFDKCDKIYSRIFLDAPTNMAQTIVPVPKTTWILDEQSYSGGSVLVTTPVVSQGAAQYWQPPTTPISMASHLNLLSTMIGAMLNSTSLSVIYTDIMNYAGKQGMEFWNFEFLYEGYAVMPEYDINFLLQMHNASIAGMPAQNVFVSSPTAVTPYNDVYPDPNKNSLYYNPWFSNVDNTVNGVARTGNDLIIDMLSDQPTLTDRVEVTRYASISKGKAFVGPSSRNGYIDTTLPDHYVVDISFELQTSNFSDDTVGTTVVPSTAFKDISTIVSMIDWAPRFFEYDTSTSTYTGRYVGDANFYTVVNEQYLRKLHDFVGLALYDVR